MRIFRKLICCMVLVLSFVPIFASAAGMLDEMKAAIGEEQYNLLPVLDVKGMYGVTGYIDYISVGMLSAPLMKGKDDAGRPFVVVAWKNLEDKTLHTDTFFQRYSDQEYPWVTGECSTNPAHNHCDPSLFRPSGVLESEDISEFAEFIKGQDVEYGYGEDKNYARFVTQAELDAWKVQMSREEKIKEYL